MPWTLQLAGRREESAEIYREKGRGEGEREREAQGSRAKCK